MPSCKVAFVNLGKSVSVKTGTTLLEAAGRAGITVNSVCGGDGICGRCRMVVTAGKYSGEVGPSLTRDEIRRGVVFACRCLVESDLVVEIPEETRARDKIVVDRDAQRFKALHPGVPQRDFSKAPLVSKVFLELPEPTLDDPVADCQRLERAISKATGMSSTQMGLKVIQRLPKLLRDHAFKVTVTLGRRRDVAEIMDVVGGDTSARNYLAVVDIGTTTVVAHVVNAIDMSTVGTGACFNSQALYGREVTARIIAAERGEAKRLQKVLVDDINQLIAGIAADNNLSLTNVTAVACAGNTTMMHLLLGLPTENIRRTPFAAATVEPPPFRAAEVGLRINPRGLLFSVPGIGSWVGGDLTAGILATGLHDADELCMLIDVGTNGEIVVGNRDWMVACSASVGPALEGAGVSCGMVAETGAIESFSFVKKELRYRVIGEVSPRGICGSAIIDLIALLLDQGIIDRAGKFVPGSHPALHVENGIPKFRICAETDAGIAGGISITQDDIDNVVTAKAAIFAAAKIILDRLALDFSEVSCLFLAGGFGSYINRENAVKIGLLPDLPINRIRYVGNTSVWGTTLAVLSEDAFGLLREIRRKTTYYDLLGSDDYMEQFSQAMFLPHTDIELFPSLQQNP